VITLIEALNFRCLRNVSQELEPFHVLVGPNASGKTTFLDVVAFLGSLVSDSLEAAVTDRTQDLKDLLWRGRGEFFELAIEAQIPEERKLQIPGSPFDTIRYEVSIGSTNGPEEVGIRAERVLLKTRGRRSLRQRELFPQDAGARQSLLSAKGTAGQKTIVNKVFAGNDNFYDETGKGWDHSFKLGPRRSALANLPEDESKFPVSTWLKGLLSQGVSRLMLNSLALRKASAPLYRQGFSPDGSNLPWVVHGLEKRNPATVGRWIKHLQTALPDLTGIRTVERADDRHRYLILDYQGEISVPSWVASDGTLRLLALTLPAYIPDFEGVYLIEEPENGIHPRAVETLFGSLSSVYGAQILLASHSPVILSLAETESVLCFARTKLGGTDIVRGDYHPALEHWKGETNLGTLFAAGVLGQ